MPVTVRSRCPSKMFPSKSLSLVVVVALFGACAVCAESPAPNAGPPAPEPKSSSVGLTAILNCMWEDDAAECLRTQSARALQELSSSATTNSNGEVEEPTFLEVLREGSARVLELFSEDEHKEADPSENVADNEHERTAEEGRKKVKIPKIGGKKGKKGGGLLQTFYMLKMMFGMLVSMKIAAMSFLLQIKSFFLSLIFVGIAVIQFIWKLQEKKSHGSTWQAYEPAPAHGHQSHGTDSYGGGWDKRSATATAAAAGILTDPIGSTLSGHDQAFRAHRPL